MLHGDISNRPAVEVVISMNSVVIDRIDKKFYGLGKPKVFLNSRNCDKLNTIYMRTEYSFSLAGVEYTEKEKEAIMEELDKSNVLHSQEWYFDTYGELFNHCKKFNQMVYTDSREEHQLLRPYSLLWSGSEWT